MNKVVSYISFCLWIIYFFLTIYREIKRNNKCSKIYKMVKKPFHLFRIDNIFFLIIYLIYTNFRQDVVLPYLYLVIVLTNIVYLIYELADNYDFKKLNKNEFLPWTGGLFIVLLLIVYIIRTQDFLHLYTITLAINIFIPSYVYLIKAFKKNWFLINKMIFLNSRRIVWWLWIKNFKVLFWLLT